MGIIAMVTPGIKHQTTIPRQHVRAKHLAVKGKINIHFLQSKHQSYTTTQIWGAGSGWLRISRMQNLNFLWKIYWPLRSPRPVWSGMMQSVCKGAYSGQSSITFLPMIDMSPSDPRCFYSTLKFVGAEFKHHNVTPVVTFDQTLCWIAQIKLASEPHGSELHPLVIRLGRFHAEMRFGVASAMSYLDLVSRSCLRLCTLLAHWHVYWVEKQLQEPSEIIS